MEDVRYWRKFRKRNGEEYEEEDPDSGPSGFKHGPFRRKKERVSDEYLLYRSIEKIGWQKKNKIKILLSDVLYWELFKTFKSFSKNHIYDESSFLIM